MADARDREKLQQIRAWLGKAFEGYAITDRNVSPAAAAGFAIEAHSRTYYLEIDRDFLDSHAADELPRVLDSVRLHDELCRAEGMPMILTQRGVRLVSSN